MKQSRNHRRSLRLQAYDYGAPGDYFVTICTFQRRCCFGSVDGGKIDMSVLGEAAATCWREIPDHFSHAALDVFTVMPNHLHGIISITEGRGTACRAPTDVRKFGKPESSALSTIIRSFKSATTKLVNNQLGTPGAALWQRNYYEHVIRDEFELGEIRQYIDTNLLRWELDKYYPKDGKP